MLRWLQYFAEAGRPTSPREGGRMCAMSLGVRLETFRGGGGATGERLVRLTFRGQ